MFNPIQDEYVDDYIELYLKLTNDYDRLRQLETEGNINTEEYKLYLTVLKKHSILEDILLNKIYRYSMVPQLKKYQDIRELKNILIGQIKSKSKKKLNRNDLVLISYRVETAIKEIFDIEKKDLEDIHEFKLSSSILDNIYEREEIEKLSLDDIYNSFLTYSYIINETNINNALFLQQEIENAAEPLLKRELIRAKYELLFSTKYLEREILLNNRSSFNFSLNKTEKENRINDKFDNCKLAVGRSLLEDETIKLIAIEDFKCRELEKQVVTTLKKSGIRSGLLLLNDEEVKIFHSIVMEAFKEYFFDRIDEYRQEINIINEACQRHKLDKGFARNLRIVK